MIEDLLSVHIRNSLQTFHSHKAMELDLILQGSMRVSSALAADKASAGDLLLINGEDLHAIEEPSDDLLYVQILFELRAFNKYLPDVSEKYFGIGHDDNEISRNLKKEIRHYIYHIVYAMGSDDRRGDKERIVLKDALEILSNLSLNFKYAVAGDKNKKKPEFYSRIWDAMDYIYDNSDRKLPIEEVASQVFVSPAYLSRMLKEVFGCGYEYFLMAVRVEQSIPYLLSTDMSITNIAQEVGFSALRYYKASFKSVFGLEPAEWRKQNKGLYTVKLEEATSNLTWEAGIDQERVRSLLKNYKVAELEYEKRDEVGECGKKGNKQKLSVKLTGLDPSKDYVVRWQTLPEKDDEAPAGKDKKPPAKAAGEMNLKSQITENESSEYVSGEEAKEIDIEIADGMRCVISVSLQH